MTKRNLSPLFTWRGAVMSPDSGVRSTVRLVALGLSLHMNERGGSAWPSVDTLAGETGLDRSTVQRSLRELESTGWLICIDPGGGRGHPARWEAEIPKGRSSEAFSQRAADEETAASDTGKAAEDTQRAALVPINSRRLRPEDVIEDVQEDVSEVVTIAPRSRPRDELFEFLAFVETGAPYDPTRSLPANLRGRINAAASQARKAGFEIPDLTEALEGWASAMPEHTRVTANGLVTNAYRCINAFHGAAFAPRESDSVRRLREAMGTP